MKQIDYFIEKKKILVDNEDGDSNLFSKIKFTKRAWLKSSKNFYFTEEGIPILKKSEDFLILHGSANKNLNLSKINLNFKFKIEKELSSIAVLNHYKKKLENKILVDLILLNFESNLRIIREIRFHEKSLNIPRTCVIATNKYTNELFTDKDYLYFGFDAIYEENYIDKIEDIANILYEKKLSKINEDKMIKM